ncbi:hypothetical protein EBU99_02610 [bacterium]|nr:hypothetical protein [bacterium]
MSKSSKQVNRRALSERQRLWLICGSGCIALAALIQSCCEVSAASDVERLAGQSSDACAANHAKGQMSVKVSNRVADWDNTLLLSTWNGALKTFVKPDVLTLKSVDSADGGTDTIRFLQIDGKFANGLGVGSRVIGTLFKEGGRGAGLLGSSTITSIHEALEVKSPTPDLTKNKFKKISGFLQFDTLLTQRRPDGLTAEFAPSYDSNEQWSLNQTHYDAAEAELLSAANAAGKTVRVAVLDTGVDVNHPDLKDVIDKDLAYNALTGKNGVSEVTDNQGHGTHVAGIIAGQGKGKASGMYTNILGVAGKFKVKIVPIKVLGDDGSGSTAAMNRGIRWATQKNVDVISMSLGSGSEYDCLKSQSLKDPVIQEAIDKGIIVVAAAGNESCALGGNCTQGNTQFSAYTVLPCAAENVLCVGSNDFAEKASTFSNFASATSATGEYRQAPDISAPGSRILSTYPTTTKFAEYEGVAILDGTSMATPYISGVAAILKLVASSNYPVNQATFKTYLQEAAYKSTDYQSKFGAGRVDLNALNTNRKNKYENKSTTSAVAGAANVLSFPY